MKILFVAFAYPPFPAVGALRAMRIVERLTAAGHEVLVLTARLPGDETKVRVDTAALVVRTVKPWLHPKAVYRALKKLRTGRSEVGPPTRSTNSVALPAAASSGLAAWKRRVVSLANVPDEHQGFVIPALATAICSGFKPDAVYTTSPPQSSHVVGLGYRLLTRTPWIAELRDPWVKEERSRRPPHENSRAAEALDRVLERVCLGRADTVVTVTESTAESLRQRRIAPSRTVVVRNGIDTIEALPGQPGTAPFTLLYTGGFAKARDPRPLLRAVSRLVRQKALDPSDIRVEFVGSGRQYRGEDLAELADDLGIGPSVRFLDRIPNREVLEKQKVADLLILLAQEQPAQVPNKLYEYLGAMRPILAWVDAGGETAEILRGVGGHYLVTERDGWNGRDALADAFEGFLSGRRFRASAPDREALVPLLASTQLQRVVDLVERFERRP